LIFETLEPEFRDGSQLSQVEIYFCPNCDWQEPSLLVKDEEENIQASEEQKYQKERDLVEKIVATLLPQQHIKVRFVKDAFFRDETLHTKKARKGATYSYELT
jgi:hypothetical protein